MSNLFLRANTLSRTLVRQYAFKSDLKIKWIRPEKIPCYDPRKSGDLEKLPQLNENEIMPRFQLSKELETADESVRKLFLLNANPRKERTTIVSTDMTKSVQRHLLDYGSMESKCKYISF